MDIWKSRRNGPFMGVVTAGKEGSREGEIIAATM